MGVFTSLQAFHHSHIMFRQLPPNVQLSHYSVMALHQDERGLIWIGTRNGVDVYDGSDLYSYRHDPTNPNSLVNNSVLGIMGDGNGHIYIHTEHGISRFDEAQERFTTLTIHAVTAMTYADRLYKAVGHRVYVYDEEKFTTFYQLPSSRDVVTALHVRGDSLLMGTEASGLFVYDRRRNRLSQPIEGEDISNIYRDRHGRYWIGTREHGLYRMDGQEVRNYCHEKGNPRSINSDFVRACMEDEKGHLWVGTFAGLCDFDEDTESFTVFSLKEHVGGSEDASVWSLMCGRQGILWVGTYFNGLSYFHPRQEYFSVYKESQTEGEGLSASVVSVITEDDEGRLWIGTDGGGLNCLDRKTGRFSWYRRSEQANSLSHNTVTSLYYDRQRQALWIGTYLGGLNRMDLRTRQFTHYIYKVGGTVSTKGNSVWDIQPYGDALLLGTEGGVLHFDVATGQFESWFQSGREGAVITKVRSLEMDAEGQLWIADDVHGVFSYNFSSRLLTQRAFDHFDPKSMSGRVVNCIFRDSRDRLWFGMEESGTDRYDTQTGNFYNYESKLNLLGSDCVYGICELSDSTMLMTTSRGFSLLDEFSNVFRNFDQKTGVPLTALSENSLYRTRDGEVFIGGIDGMVSFRPGDLAGRTGRYQVFPYRLYVNGSEVKVGDATGILTTSLFKTETITLRPGQDLFTIKYAVTDYVPQSRLRVKYQLEPFSKDWTEMREGWSVTYSNLAPGEYTLTVQVLSSADVKPIVSRLRIEVLRPWYLSPFAWLLYVTGVCGVAFFLARVYRDRVWRQVEELMLAQRHEQRRDPLRVAEYDMVQFLNDSYVRYAELARENRISYTFRKSDDVIRVWFDALQLRQVVEALLENAFRYTPPEGVVVLAVRHHPDYVAVEVSVSQRGPQEQLELIQEVVGRHHGKVETLRTSGKSGAVIFRIPIGPECYTLSERIG